MTSIEFCSQLLGLEHSLLKFAYHFNLKRADAKDLVQETYLRALMNQDKYVDTQKFKSWTLTIMKNTFVDNYRSSLRKKTYTDTVDESSFFTQKEPLSPDNPDSEYSALEINRNIEQLKDALRVPFTMYINGYKYSEIADMLNLKIGTVKNRIFLSRKQLMSQLSW
jgi:RNA polymerase sigma factor (sigma-70 family)